MSVEREGKRCGCTRVRGHRCDDDEDERTHTHRAYSHTHTSQLLCHTNRTESTHHERNSEEGAPRLTNQHTKRNQDAAHALRVLPRAGHIALQRSTTTATISDCTIINITQTNDRKERRSKQVTRHGTERACEPHATSTPHPARRTLKLRDRDGDGEQQRARLQPSQDDT